MLAIHLTLFALLWIVVVYLFNALLIKSFPKINLKLALMYVSAMSLIGVVGEIFVGSIYNAIFGNLLWQYQVLSIHDGYTSYYAPVIWGIYGFYIYLLHDNLIKNKSYTNNRLTVIFSIEAIIIEALVNLSFLLLFGYYLFYYTPGDLWHLTSVQTFPFYFVAGYIITRTLNRFKLDPNYFTLLSLALTFVLVFLV